MNDQTLYKLDDFLNNLTFLTILNELKNIEFELKYIQKNPKDYKIFKDVLDSFIFRLNNYGIDIDKKIAMQVFYCYIEILQLKRYIHITLYLQILFVLLLFLIGNLLFSFTVFIIISIVLIIFKKNFDKRF